MSSQITFTSEELLKRAQDDQNFYFLSTISYLKERGMPLDDYAAFMESKGATTWSKDLNAMQLARGLARNWAGMGGSIRSISGDESQAEIVVEGWPPGWLLELFALSHQEADLLWMGLGERFAKRYGLAFGWRREGNDFTVTLSPL